MTINWDPPAYHYSEVVSYYVTLLIYKICNGGIARHYVASHTGVGCLHHQCRFWCSFPFQKLDSASLLQFSVIMIRLDMCRPCPLHLLLCVLWCRRPVACFNSAALACSVPLSVTHYGIMIQSSSCTLGNCKVFYSPLFAISSLAIPEQTLRMGNHRNLMLLHLLAGDTVYFIF